MITPPSWIVKTASEEELAVWLTYRLDIHDVARLMHCSEKRVHGWVAVGIRGWALACRRPYGKDGRLAFSLIDVRQFAQLAFDLPEIDEFTLPKSLQIEWKVGYYNPYNAANIVATTTTERTP